MNIAFAIRALPLGLTLLVASSLHAQDGRFPNKPIKLIQGGAPGGASEQLGRAIGEELVKAWGQPYIIEAKPGANQQIAIQSVIQSSPDGHTLFIGTTAYTLNLALRTDATYGPNDLAPVSHLTSLPTLMVASSSLKVDTFAGLVSLVKANPSKYSFASTGQGSAPHFNGELLNRESGMDLTHIPYKGEAAMLNDLIGGRVSVGWGSVGTLLPLAKAGHVKLIAITGDRRATAIPEVPTFKELGFPSLLTGYFGLWAPAKTPKATIKKLADEIGAIMRTPHVMSAAEKMGAIPLGYGPVEFNNFLAEQFTTWQDAGKKTGIKVQ